MKAVKAKDGICRVCGKDLVHIRPFRQKTPCAYIDITFTGSFTIFNVFEVDDRVGGVELHGLAQGAWLYPPVSTGLVSHASRMKKWINNACVIRVYDHI